MSTPLVGLSTYREQATAGGWRQCSDLLPGQYADAVAAVGGVPVLLPPAATHPTGTAPTTVTAASLVAAAHVVVSRLDALVVTGGADVDPGGYAAEPDARTVETRPGRDLWERALLDAAAGAGLPVLGVCRGMQLMAVHAGGRLVQHLPDVVGHEGHSSGGDTYLANRVRTEPGSRVAALVGANLTVYCHHHQAVPDTDAAHPGYQGIAWAEDGTLEAMEQPGERFVVAVQWHPETAADVGLLAGLVEAAADHRR